MLGQIDKSIVVLWNGFAGQSDVLTFVTRAYDFWLLILLGVVSLMLIIYFDYYHAGNNERGLIGAIKGHLGNLTGYVISGAAAWLLTSTLKPIFALPRPFEVISEVIPLVDSWGYSMPSGHATVLAVMGLYVFRSEMNFKYKIVLILLIIGGGLSRVTAGVHYLSDVLAGFVLGVIVAYFFQTYLAHRLSFRGINKT